MLVSGTIQINPDGSVRQYTMDHADKIPGIVLFVIKQTVPAWRFHVDTAHNVIAKAKMSIRVVAKPANGNKMDFSVEGVSFDEADEPASTRVTERHVSSPVYPKQAMQEFASATVYMLARIGHDGHVVDLAPEQVNFTRPIERNVMPEMAKLFIASTKAAMRRWTFAVPTTGPEADAAFWIARVPVAFNIETYYDAPKTTAYGSWQPYLAGPRLPAPPWFNDGSGLASAPDAIPEQGIVPLHNALRLTGSDHGP
ncbi:MAG: energy transducer TonB [Pseudomonadota bacterium]|nr:energy transducer TonB [Pseudomonadota bacterium]